MRHPTTIPQLPPKVCDVISFDRLYEFVINLCVNKICAVVAIKCPFRNRQSNVFYYFYSLVAGVVHCGKLISNMSLCCRQAFQAQDVCPRIVIAMNTCTIQTNAETMGTHNLQYNYISIVIYQ